MTQTYVNKETKRNYRLLIVHVVIYTPGEG